MTDIPDTSPDESRVQMIARHEFAWPATTGSELTSVPADAEASFPLRLNFDLRGIRPGLTASVQPLWIKGTWYGSRKARHRLRGSDYQAVLDFSGRGPGHGTLPVFVTGPDSKHVVLEPDSVRVVLRGPDGG